MCLQKIFSYTYTLKTLSQLSTLKGQKLESMFTVQQIITNTYSKVICLYVSSAIKRLENVNFRKYDTKMVFWPQRSVSNKNCLRFTISKLFLKMSKPFDTKQQIYSTFTEILKLDIFRLLQINGLAVQMLIFYVIMKIIPALRFAYLQMMM